MTGPVIVPEYEVWAVTGYFGRGAAPDGTLLRDHTRYVHVPSARGVPDPTPAELLWRGLRGCPALGAWVRATCVRLGGRADDRPLVYEGPLDWLLALHDIHKT